MSNYKSSDLDIYSAAFSALSNPHRLRIYAILAGCCEAGERCLVPTDVAQCVGEIGRHLDIAASTLSHHLKELSRADLIRMNREGKQIYCSVNPGMLAKMRSFFDQDTASATNEPNTTSTR